MVKLAFFIAGLAISSASGAPLKKRIAQTISASTAKWEQACLAAGGGQQCNPLSVTAFSTLLAAPGPCEQQDAADSMIDLAKTLGNDAEMIRLAQIFAQQPRNTPTSLSTPYCQTAPRNPELNGLFQCQFASANLNTFVGGIAVGGAGTVPFGLSAPLNPLGSCPAKPDGPVPDGEQLVDLVQSPGSGNAPSPGGNNSGNAPPPLASSTTVAAPPAATTSMGGGAGGNFRLQNGRDAQALNARFATLTADSPCSSGDQACVNGGFAQCVNGRFAITSCGATLTCAALPLVNNPGTSITCTTQADAVARIEATGATGGLTGNGSGSNAPAPAPAPSPSPSPSPAPPVNNTPSGGNTGSGAGGFRLQNGQDAQALNAKFAGLSADSSCTDGDQACVNGGFAQCVGGQFVITPCAGGLICAALPLVNSPGTSIACTTQADALARIQATGATGGITGA